jgi:predicted  nucleic acid-binding Zn-ribbon protein
MRNPWLWICITLGLAAEERASELEQEISDQQDEIDELEDRIDDLESDWDDEDLSDEYF